MSLLESLESQQSELLVIKAAEIELTEGTEAALKILGAPTNPILMRSVLDILVRANRYKEALDLIDGRKVENKWIDIGVFLCAYFGEYKKAKSLISKSEDYSNNALVYKTRLAFAEGIIKSWQASTGYQSLFSIKSWSCTDQEVAKLAVDVLIPILSHVRANRIIEGEFQLAALKQTIIFAHIIKNDSLISECSDWLLSHTPIPLFVAELCLQGIINCPDSIPNRLRLEHAGEFQAHFLAALLEREVLHKVDLSFEHFCKLSEQVRTENEKESICLTLFETCSQLYLDSHVSSMEFVDKAIEITENLCPNNTKILGFINIYRHGVAKDWIKARQLLDEIIAPDDSIWWQLHALICEQEGKYDLAETAWNKASELLPDSNIIRRSAQLSFERKKYKNVVRRLKSLIEIEPESINDLEMLVDALIHIGDIQQAIIHLRQLRSLNPNNHKYAISYAQCLGRTAQLNEAIEVLQPLCDEESSSLNVLLLQGKLLVANDRALDALNLLETVASDYWDNAQFLLAHMNYAHAAGKDSLAYDSFVRLNELRIIGKLPSGIMQSGTLEELLEYHKQFNKRRELLQREVINGKLPWLFVEDHIGNPLTWAWSLHTQKLKWLSEEPLNRASYSIYSTNSFTSNNDPEDFQLRSIISAPKNSDIIVDLTALITLFKLDLLEDATDFYSSLIIPLSYGSLRLEDADKFGLHQVSRKHSLQLILNSIQRNQIHYISNNGQDLIQVNEYTEDVKNAYDQHIYRISDLILTLEQTQRSTSDEIEELRKVAHLPRSASDHIPQLKLGDSLAIDLVTLMTLATQSVFSDILDTFAIYIHPNDRDKASDELAAYEVASHAKATNDEMWDTVNKLVAKGKIKWCSIDDEKSQSGFSDSRYWHSLELAKENSLPVLVDDRVLQVVILRQNIDPPYSAFGIDSFLNSLLNTGNYDVDKLSGLYSRLLEWRYRFLIPPVPILKNWAIDSINNLPGKSLLALSIYLHDCLRDPALHCGAESPDYPVSMAVKLVTTWNQNIIDFLADIWSDDYFSNEGASSLTIWVCEELLPSCPSGLFLTKIGHNIARFLPDTVLMLAMVKFAVIKKSERANLGLRLISDSLNIDEDKFLKATISAIEVVQQDAENLEEQIQFSLLILRNSLFHQKTHSLEPVFVYQFQELGLLEDVTPPELPEDTLEIIQNSNHPRRQKGPNGPFVFVREDDQNNYVFEVGEFLLRPEKEIRHAAIAYLIDPKNRVWLSPSSYEKLIELACDVKSDQKKQWLSAGIILIPMLKNDLFGIFASYEQSKHFQYKGALNQYLHSIIHPKFDTLVSVKPTLSNPNNPKDELTEAISKFAKSEFLYESLSEYVHTYGYIPFCHEQGASKLVKEWITVNPESSLTWNELWAWAERSDSPFAKYHALSIALHIPKLRVDDVSIHQIWTEVDKILEIFEEKLELSPQANDWQTLCGLALHYSFHIETLVPGQDGERASSHAWWLTNQVGKLFYKLYGNNSKVLAEITKHETLLSKARWTVAQSPVAPSLLRFLTLERHSIWSLSLLCQISDNLESLNITDIPDEIRTKLGKILKFYFIFSPLAAISKDDSKVYAFQENSNILNLCKIMFPEEEYIELEELNINRSNLKIPSELQSHLTKIKDLHVNDQFVLILFLRELVFTSTEYDETIISWLSLSDQVAEDLLILHDNLLYRMLEALGELQKRQEKKWVIRIPHILAYALEQTDNKEQADLLINSIYLMSVNSDLASPIQRVLNSKWRAEMEDLLKDQRDNLIFLTKHSEPWIGARSRAILALISRHLGPRDYTAEELETVNSES
tara:strand:- start:1424 stop:6841 length:5418 start_codon:yes stop_codon:yes gene_type:complete